MHGGSWSLLLAVAVFAGAACSPDEGASSSPGDCRSHYEDLARAASRPRLDARLTSTVDPSVVRLRVQGTVRATGDAHQPAEIVDLLNTRGRRVMQVEVFRLGDGQWYAGRWAQCID
jgi:hypothetical protein